MLLDDRMSRMMDSLAPHRGVHDMTTPRALSHVMQHPKEMIGNAANYLDSTQDISEHEQLQTMAQWLH